MKQAGLIGSASRPVKILGVGDLKEALQISGIAVSKSAAEKITAAGGTVAVDEAPAAADKE